MSPYEDITYIVGDKQIFTKLHNGSLVCVHLASIFFLPLTNNSWLLCSRKMYEIYIRGASTGGNGLIPWGLFAYHFD